MYRKRRYRRKSSKPQKLALIGFAAAVTIGAFLTLLNIKKQIDADSASSAQESETTVTAADAVPVNDIVEPEKIALISGNVTTADSVKLPDEIKQLLLDYTSDKYEYAGELKYSSLSPVFQYRQYIRQAVRRFLQYLAAISDICKAVPLCRSSL